jgi:hypothetical protein
MRLDELRSGLTSSGRFSAAISDGLVRVASVETGSEFVVEEFDGSFQVRQALCFDCLEWPPQEILSLYGLCSMANERFSGCKMFVDRWGALVMASDILGSVASVALVEIILDQTEFMSQAMLGLVETIRGRGSAITDEELDSALDTPMLQ